MPKFEKNPNPIMKKGPFTLHGMTFKEGQAPMKKISLGKVLSKVKAGVEKKITNVVENVKTKVGNVGDLISDVSTDNNGNGNGNGETSAMGTPPSPDLPKTPIVKRVYKK